jgi:hypothetical protein
MKSEHVAALEELIKSGRCTRQDIDAFTEKERIIIAKATLEYLEKGDSLLIKKLSSPELDFEVPSIIKFIEDPYYLGSELGYPRDNLGKVIKGEQRQFYNFWMEKLEELYRVPGKYHEVDATGAIGIGKTTAMNVIAAYDLLTILAIKHPQMHFGLIPSTKIIFAFFNIQRSMADDVGYAQFHGLLNSSPFFNEHMKRNIRMREGYQLKPPKEIYFKVGSRISHTLGIAVLEAQIDEANFGQEQEDKRTDVKKSQVFDNYTSLLRRRESRFPGLPGHFCLGSSKKIESSFLEAHIEKNKNRPGVFVVDAPQYVVKKDRNGPDGEPLYKGKMFRVLLGDETRDPKILSDDDVVAEELSDKVEAVPMEHKQAFDDNIIEALRDISGKSSQPKYAFILDRQKVRDLISKTRQPPWKYMTHGKTISNTINVSFYEKDQVSDSLVKELLFTNNGLLPYPKSPRYIAFDTGYAGDACGCAMGCKAGVKVLKKEDPVTKQVKNYFIPKYYTDFIIRIKGKGKEQYPLVKCEEFVKFLKREWGIYIAGMSVDGFQSVQLQQDIKIAFPDMLIEQISVDKDDSHYLSYRNMIYNQAIEGLYTDNNFLVEVCDLIHVSTGRRGNVGNMYKMIVDHPVIASDGFVGRKDVVDAHCSLHALIRIADTSVSEEEVKENIEELRHVDVAELVKQADEEAEKAIKEIESLNLDDLFQSDKK